jgi:hypothetical protein
MNMPSSLPSMCLVRDAAVVDIFAGHFLFAVTELAPHRLGLHGPLDIAARQIFAIRMCLRSTQPLRA